MIAAWFLCFLVVGALLLFAVVLLPWHLPLPSVPTVRTRARAFAGAGALVTGLLAACTVPSPERSDFVAADAAVQGPQVRQPSAGAASAASGEPQSVADSLALYERVLTQVGPRARILLDSIIAAEARRIEPHLFDATRTEDDDAWLLLDANFRGTRANNGREYYSTRQPGAPATAPLTAATRTTPRAQLVHDITSYTRAFPGVQESELQGLWSWNTVKVGEHTVNILWARHTPTR